MGARDSAAQVAYRSLISQEQDKAVLRALETAVAPISLLTSLMFIGLAVAHPLILEGTHRWTMCIVALSGACICFVIYQVWRSGYRKCSAHCMLGMAAIVVAINSTAQFWLYPAPEHTTNFIVLTLAMGLLLLSRAWFYLLGAAIFTIWLAMVAWFEFPNLFNWDWFYFFAMAAAIMLHEQRLGATQAIAQREAVLHVRNEQLRQLLRLPEISQGNHLQAYGRVADAAMLEFSPQSVQIWIVSEDQTRKRVAVRGDETLASEWDLSPFARVLDRLEDSGTLELAGSELAPDYPLAMVNAGGIMVSGRLHGFIKLDYDQSHGPWSTDDHAYLNALAGVAALVVQSEEHHRLEARAHEAERLESLGILAGGVAHDFNNLLTVMIGHAEMLTTTEADVRESSGAIIEAGSRAKELAQQMLAYAGRASFVTRTVNLASLLDDVSSPWAQSLLGDVQLEVTHDANAARWVNVDATQIRQVILNLLTNARDASATHIHVAMGSLELQSAQFNNFVISPAAAGVFHWFEVTDNGQGMDRLTLERMFDPFYSRREGGTGLGLAAVLGILRAHGGTIRASSEVNRGTTLCVLLPAASEPVEELVDEPKAVELETGSGRVLLVEDEDLVSELTTIYLRKSGHTVRTLASVADYSKAQIDPHEYDCAIVDLTLGDGNGQDVIADLLAKNPRLPTIIISGYDSSEALSNFALAQRVAFLQKPYSLDQLEAAMAQASEIAAQHKP